MEDGNIEIYYPEDYETEFDGKAYLEHFYSGQAMSQGNRISLFVLPNFAEVIRKTTPTDQRLSVLDVGAGPTIYSALCFRSIVSKIYLSDYLDSNLSILNGWLEKRNDFDWLPVIKTIARNEGLLALSEVFDKIEEDTRKVVENGGVLHANVHNENILDANQNVNSSQEFDILVSIFCLESACCNMAEYKNALQNMLRRLRPGGTLILGSVIDDDNYISGVFQNKPKLFSLLNLTEKSILNALEDLVDLSSMARAGLPHQGVIFIMAKKFA